MVDMHLCEQNVCVAGITRDSCVYTAETIHRTTRLIEHLRTISIKPALSRPHHFLVVR